MSGCGNSPALLLFLRNFEKSAVNASCRATPKSTRAADKGSVVIRERPDACAATGVRQPRPPSSRRDLIKPDPNLDDYFNSAVLDNLGAFGFRRLSRSFKSDALSRPIVIKWEKGQLSMSMLVTLEVPTLGYSERIGFPFAFGAGTF